MSERGEVPTIRTNVGCAGLGENFLRGRSIARELFGRDSYWSLLSLSIDGPRLDMDASRLLDDLAVAICSPDPRIWPLKVTWIVGSYGSPLYASAAALLFFESAMVGPWACVAACEAIRAIRAIVEGNPEWQEALVSELRARLDAGSRVAGFGVAMRDDDERVPLLLRAAELHDRSAGPHLAALLRALPLIEARTSLHPNIGAALAACLLDMGYDDRQVGLMASEMVRAQLIGNALEASVLEPHSLREIPEALLRYLGPAERPSPRRGGSDNP
jgi:hypothetical protein